MNINAAAVLSSVREFLLSDSKSPFSLAILAVLLAFGFLNCILGYRLLRFWMMLAGFFGGAAVAGFLLQSAPGHMTKTVTLGIMLGAGLLLAVLAFAFYRAGVFLLTMVSVTSLLVYFVRPTSSGPFFLCLLAGVVLGILSIRAQKVITITVTSLFGGFLAGICLAGILGMPELPYGILMSLGFFLFGILVQFTINRPYKEEEEEEVISGTVHRDESRRKKEAQIQRSRKADPYKEDIPGAAFSEDDYYEAYFDGVEVLDRKIDDYEESVRPKKARPLPEAEPEPERQLQIVDLKRKKASPLKKSGQSGRKGKAGRERELDLLIFGDEREES